MLNRREIQEDFINYLQSTDNIVYTISGHITTTGEFFTRLKKYKHRWSAVYQKDLFRKLYAVRDWYEARQNPEVTLMTLTTYQKGYAIEDQLEKLASAWTYVIDVIRKDYPGIQYFRILENHKSGYGHFHVILFGKISDSDKIKYRLNYQNLYHAGSYDHGLDFTYKRTSIEHLVAYVMSYVRPPSYDFGDDLCVNDFLKVPGWLAMHSTLWAMWRDPDYKNMRIFSFSNNLNQYIRGVSDDITNVVYDRVCLPGRFVWDSTRLAVENLDERSKYLIQKYHLPMSLYATPLHDGYREFMRILNSCDFSPG